MAEVPAEEVTDKVLTAPNVITLVRFLLIPFYLVLMFGFHKHTAALVVFVIACCTDWVDGQVARRTHQVSKLGQLFDPLVDRFLLASGIISVALLDRAPWWCVFLLIARDLIILVEGRISLRVLGHVTKVSYVGKFATAFLMFGFAMQLLGHPVVNGLGLLSVAWLPGLGDGTVIAGIFFIYIGIVLSLTVFVIYQVRGFGELYYKKKAERLSSAQ